FVHVMLGVDGSDDVLQFLFVIFFAGDPEHFACFVGTTFLCKPARAARNCKEHHQKKCSWDGGDAELPTPFACAEAQRATHVVGEVGKQDSEQNTELEESD